MKCLHKTIIDKKLIHLIPGVPQVRDCIVSVEIILRCFVSTVHTEFRPIIPELVRFTEWGETPKTSTFVPWSIKLSSRCILILIHPSTIYIMVKSRSEGFLNFLTLWRAHSYIKKTYQKMSFSTPQLPTGYGIVTILQQPRGQPA